MMYFELQHRVSQLDDAGLRYGGACTDHLFVAAADFSNLDVELHRNASSTHQIGICYSNKAHAKV